MDRTITSQAEYSLARSAIINKILQPSSTPNTKPMSNLTKILAGCQSRMSSMEQQLRELTQQAQTIRQDIKLTQQRLVVKNNEAHTHLQARIHHNYEETIKKGMQDAMRRYNEAKNKANELQEELEHLTGSFKKIGSRIEQLENTVGYYSGKDKLIG